jgi:hypothetical protein
LVRFPRYQPGYLTPPAAEGLFWIEIAKQGRRWRFPDRKVLPLAVRMPRGEDIPAVKDALTFFVESRRSEDELNSPPMLSLRSEQGCTAVVRATKKPEPGGERSAGAHAWIYDCEMDRAGGE